MFAGIGGSQNAFVAVGVIFFAVAAVVGFSLYDSYNALKYLLPGLAAALAISFLALIFSQILQPPTEDESDDDFHPLLSQLQKIELGKKFEIMFLAVATAGGLFALQAYKETNGIAMMISLEDRDSAFRAQYLLSRNRNGGNRSVESLSDEGDESSEAWDGVDLMRVFSDVPPIESVPDEDYKACSQTTRVAIRGWAVDYVNRAAQVKIEWETIPDLYNELWLANNMLNRDRDLARVLVMHSIDYLYLYHDALRAYQRRYFDIGDYEMWEAYISDLGSSPFFLLAIEDGVGYEYMNPVVQEAISKHFSADEKLKCIVDALYPEFLDSGKSRRGSLMERARRSFSE